MGYDALGPGLAGATKEMVMSFPIRAFVKSTAEASPKGGLFYAGGNWWFRSESIVPTGTRQNILALTGPQSGSIGRADNSPGLTLAEGYSWDLRIKDPQDSAFSDGPRPGTIVVNDGGGVEFWGHIIGVPEHRHGFDVLGDQVPMYNEADGRPYLHYRSYEVWLLDQNGNLVGGKPIFETVAA